MLLHVEDKVLGRRVIPVFLPKLYLHSAWYKKRLLKFGSDVDGSSDNSDP